MKMETIDKISKIADNEFDRIANRYDISIYDLIEISRLMIFNGIKQLYTEDIAKECDSKLNSELHKIMDILIKQDGERNVP